MAGNGKAVLWSVPYPEKGRTIVTGTPDALIKVRLTTSTWHPKAHKLALEEAARRLRALPALTAGPTTFSLAQPLMSYLFLRYWMNKPSSTWQALTHHRPGRCRRREASSRFQLPLPYVPVQVGTVPSGYLKNRRTARANVRNASSLSKALLPSSSPNPRVVLVMWSTSIGSGLSSVGGPETSVPVASGRVHVTS
jgi:hypothetical protein